MIALRTEREIEILRAANRIVADVLAELAGLVAPGVTTAELDAIAERMIRDRGAKPAFLGYHGYPNTTCISVDAVIVHGIPNERKIEEGRIVSIDVGTEYKGYFGDAALSIPCGQVDAERQRLLKTTELALERAISAAQPGNYLCALSRAIEETCKVEEFGVVRKFVGHGIGTEMHEEPQIPNFDTGKRGPKLCEGMVLAIEPMVNLGTHEVEIMDDGWTAVTADGKPSAHFEHSIVVRNGGGEVLSMTPRRTWACDLQ